MMQNVTTGPQIIQPTGHLNASNAPQLQEQLTAAVLSPETQALLVNLEQVESLDSAGLMALVSALSLTQRLNKQFSLCSVSPSIKIIFELTQLDRVFEILENPATFANSRSLTS